MGTKQLLQVFYQYYIHFTYKNWQSGKISEMLGTYKGKYRCGYC